MPSLRQKVTTYFRQLSFIADQRDGNGHRVIKDKHEQDGNFITKYLEGRMERIFVPGVEVLSGQNATDMPDLKLAAYMSDANVITAACTGPDEGLTGIKRSKLHLSASFADDIDFIDTIADGDCYEERRSTTTTTTAITNSARNQNNKLNRSNKQTLHTNDQNANKLNSSIRSRKNSKSSISNLNQSNTTATITANSNTHQNTKETLENANGMAATKATTKNTTEAINKKGNTILETDKNSENDQNNKNLLNTTTTTTKTDCSTGKLRQTKDSNITTTTETDDVTITTSQKKLLPDTEVERERLLQEAMSNQTPASVSGNLQLIDTSIAGVSNWKMASEYAFGISVSLYETNQLTKEATGNPIADCYGLVVRGDAALMALADGVNWGDGARLAARSAVHGCLDYLDRAIFGLTSEMTSTQEVFVSLLRSLWEGHGCILEVGGALSTLTVAVVLPVAEENATSSSTNEQLEQRPQTQKYVVCGCNVGDSLGYVYSKKHGVREFTQASHDITSMRDMRDALGALGPADGNKPEMSNLTFSMTTIERGDIVFLTSDGISDNFDPVVGKFAEAWTPDIKLPAKNLVPANNNVLAPKRQNKSASAIYARLHSTNCTPVPMPRTKKNAAIENAPAHSRPKYMRSHTVIEARRPSANADVPAHMRIQKSAAGLPLVTAAQRHALTIYRLEDLLSYGINGTFSPCVSARRLCHLLIDFVRMITSARRKTLEQRELFYKLSTGADGVRREVELNRMQHRAARKRIIDSSAFSALPGKLDHATVVAYTVGGASQQANNHTGPMVAALQSKEFKETNF